MKADAVKMKSFLLDHKIRAGTLWRERATACLSETSTFPRTFFFVGLKFELRASLLLGKWLLLEPHL
jgi:hypothetical protein